MYATATGQPVKITLPPDPQYGNPIQQVLYSYNGPAPLGRLKITSANVIVFDVDLAAAAASWGQITFARPLGGGTNEEIVITLSPGEASTIGKLNVLV